MSWSDKRFHLETHGYVVVPFLFGDEKIEQKFDRTLLTFPEYSEHAHRVSRRYILSKFGAYGNPSSFHNPLVRSLRKRYGKVLEKLFPQRPKQILMDRMCMRLKGDVLGKEGYHRDQALATTNTVFGGWMNLNDEVVQHFACVPKTHTSKENGTGFIKISPEKSKEYQAQEVIVEIPPKHLIIFYQNIIHRVAGGKVQDDIKRLFIGFSIQSSPGVPLQVVDFSTYIANQGVPPLPSGVRPQMLENNHLCYPKNREKAVLWSQKTFKPECMNAEKGYVERHMRSLREMGLRMYAEYSEEDKRVVSGTYTF